MNSTTHAHTGRRRAWRIVKRAAQLGALATVAFAAVAIVDGWAAFGKSADGARRGRMEASPHYDDGVFVNPQPLYNDAWGMLTGALSTSEVASPPDPVPVELVDPARFDAAPRSGLRVTWLGHSTMLLEIDGHRVLTDPVWGERSSPLTWLGPARWYPPLVELDALPDLDAVVISHDHYDHLDYPTIVAMRDWDTVFVVPLGVGAHLAYWGVPDDRIVELDWWDRHTVGALEIVATPARHASGRTLLDKDATLWSSYALVGPRHRVWFSGDTGLFPALHDIGQELGPFDLTMVEAGAYGNAWPDWHLGPEQAVTAHRMVRGEVMLPVHWGLFALAYHGWTEPIERVRVAAAANEVTVITPRPGQSVEPADAAAISSEPWWPELPWRSAAEDPIVATKMDGAVVPQSP